MATTTTTTTPVAIATTAEATNSTGPDLPPGFECKAPFLNAFLPHPHSPCSVGSFAFLLVVVATPLLGLTFLILLWLTIKYLLRLAVHRYHWVIARPAEDLSRVRCPCCVGRKALLSAAHGRSVTQIGAPSMRERVDNFMQTHPLALAWNVFQTIISLVAFGFYIAELYNTSTDVTGFFLGELVLTAFFLMDYAINLYASRNKLKWVWSFMGLVDMLTIVPTLGELVVRLVWSSTTAVQLQFLRALRVMRTLRILRVLKITKVARGLVRACVRGWLIGLPQYSADESQKRILQWFLAVVCVLLVSTGIMQAVMPGDLSFHTTLYFMVITLSTTGYGDIVPTTAVSRGFITAIVFIVFPLAGYQTARLVHLYASYDPRKGHFRTTPQRVHLIITGPIKYSNVLPMFREIFHKERSQHYISVCLLGAEPPDADLEFMLCHEFYTQR